VSRLALAALAAVVLLAAGAGVAIAAFSATTSSPGNTFTAANSFAVTSVLAPYDLRDASGGGAETNASWDLAFDDSILFRTTNWAATYSTSRYVDFDMNGPLGASRPVSTANFRMRFASRGGPGSGNACFYFEVRRISTGAVLGTYGSSGSPVACSAGATQVTSTTDISAQIPTTTVANDLRIRVYGVETGAKAWDIEAGTVTGSTPFQSFTLYPNTMVDAADSTPASTPWGVAASGDGVNYLSANGWRTAFDTARYIEMSFPAYVPAGSTITSASLAHAYKANNNGDTVCWYFEVYNGASLIGTHGSAGTPAGCNATNNFVTDTVALPEIDTVAEANNAIVKMFFRNSSNNRRSQHDRVALTLNL
jgi:hypothetical protein